MNLKIRAKRQIVEARNWWNGMDAVSQIYLCALIMTLVSIALLRWQPDDRPTQTLAQVAFALFAIAFLREVYRWIVPKLELPLVKLTLTALGVIAVATATGVSRILVNEATGQDPSYFGTTVTLLVPVSFVPVVAVAVLFVGGFVLAATMLWTLLHSFTPWKTESNRAVLVGFSRAFAALVIVYFASSLLTPSSPLFPAIRWLASYSAHMFDAQPNSACTIHQDERVLRMNDDLVILSRITADGPQFVRRACPLAAE